MVEICDSSVGWTVDNHVQVFVCPDNSWEVYCGEKYPGVSLKFEDFKNVS